MTPQFVATAGPVFQRVLADLPLWMGLTAAAAVLCFAVARWLIKRQLVARTEAWRTWTQSTLEPGAALSVAEWLALVGFCALLMVVLDGRAFAHGFFRFDDFSLLQTARENRPIGEYLRLYHNDHSLPLLRVEVWLLVHACGEYVSTDRLAAVFNALGAVTCLAFLISACWALVEAGVSRLMLLCFCSIVWAWPGWGEFTAGFFTLLAYPQTGVLGFCALAMLLRSCHRDDWRWLAGSLTCATLATGIDVSGIWVFAMLLSGGVLILRTRSLRRASAFAVCCLVVALVAACYHLVIAPHAFTERELVQNPSGQTLRTTLMSQLAANAWKLPRVLSYGAGGTLTSIATPAFVSIAVQRLDDSRPIVRGLAVLEIATTLLMLGGCIHVLRTTTGRRRAVIVAVLGASAVLIGMTSVARLPGLDVPGALWPTKYKCVPFGFLAAAGVLFVDERLRTVDDTAAKRLATGAATAGLFALWLALPLWQIEKRIGWDWLWEGGGRYHNVRLAELRRQEFDVFVADVSQVAAGRRNLPVPPEKYGYRVYPFLEMGSSVQNGSTYRYTDLLSAAPATGLTLTIVSPTALPVEVATALAGHPRLRRVFWEDPSAAALP